MAFEYPTPAGVVRLIKSRRYWLLDYAGRTRGRWSSPDKAAAAAAAHRTGLPEWDQGRAVVPDDLLDWRPLGASR